MASSMSLFLLGFLVIFVAGGCVDMPVMEQEELFGLFEVMGSLLEDPTWAQMHPLPCTDTPWPGVECEVGQETQTPIFHVTKIHVGHDILTPPCKSSAQISLSLLKLPYLKTLSLMNCFTKSPVFLSKTLFGSLHSLENLVLESNPSLSGEIPSTLSNITSLKVLSLLQNNLNGEIPKEIGGLVNLEQIDISYNNLIGSIPEEIEGLKSLSILDLSWNSLQGMVPHSLGDLQFLEKIDFSWNKLQGRIPPELGKLKRLVLLDLSHNSLEGPIPENLSGLHQLQYLMMEENPINTEIPSFIGALMELTVLSFSGCGLTGRIPRKFSSLQNLTALSLDNNKLKGTVPQELGTLPNINTLNLSQNQLSGELLFPEEFFIRLDQRLDTRGNKGLCINQQPQSKKISTTFRQIPPCLIKRVPASNKTFSQDHPDDDSQKMKPTVLCDGNLSSNADGLHQNFIVSGLIFLFSCWAREFSEFFWF